MSEERLVFARKASGLVRELSALDVIIWAIGTPAISGILYFAAREMYNYSAPSIMTAYIVGGLAILPITLALAFMTASMPRSGGMYAAVSRIVSPTMAFFVSWLQLFGLGITTGVLACVSALIFGSGLIMAGTISGITALSDAGAFMTTTTGAVIGGLVLIIVLWIIGLTAIRVVKWLERFLFALPMITLALMIGFLLAYGPAGYPSAFDAQWGAGTYSAIMSKASQLNYSTPAFSWDKVGSALLITLWSYAGFEVVTYASGEVKRPARSLLIGVVGGFIGLMLLYVASVAIMGYIGDFINAYSFIYYNNKPVLESIMPAVEPSLPFFAASVMPTWLGVFVLVCMVLWYAKTILPVFVGGSRITFACAMDKMLPTKLASVNRYGAPTWSTHLMGVMALLGLYIFTMDIGPALGILTWSTTVFFWIFGLATLLFPYVRPDIFDKSPVQWKIGGVPVISIVGLFALATGFFIFAYTLTEFSIESVILVCIVLSVGLILHAWQMAKNKREGIQITDIYSSLPPE